MRLEKQGVCGESLSEEIEEAWDEKCVKLRVSDLRWGGYAIKMERESL
jgi:hypothetical protein